MTAEHVTDSFQERTLVIVGVGLIGGSIAAALRKRKFAGQIIGVGRSARRLDDARDAGLIDFGTTELADAAARADLMVFCTPVDRIADGVLSAIPHCRPDTLITDAGSVKGCICRELSQPSADGVTFIGSHPLAGSEKNGFEHADADLFVGRVCVVTPGETTPRDSFRRLTAFWQSLGLTVLEMSPSDHDRALAETSHLPHVVATTLAAALSDSNRSLTSTGFADSTRIAAGDPDLWTAILLANADAVVQSIDVYAGGLGKFRAAIANRDADVLKNLLEVAKRKRDAIECK